MKLLKFCLLCTLLVGMAACSGGGTNKNGVERNSSTTEEGGTNTETPPSGEEPEPGSEPGPGPEVPVSVLLDGNLYFPIAEGVAWHYDNGDEVTFTTGELIQGRTLVSMHHSLETMPREEYFRITDNEIEYGGLFAFFAYQGAAVAGGVEFHSLRRVYDHVLDKGAQSWLAQTADLVNPDGELVSEVDYVWSSKVGEKELVATGQFGLVPAVELVINVDLVILDLGGIPIQTFPVIETSLWLSPGLGIVGRSLLGTTIMLERVDGIQAPVVFAFDEGTGLAQTPQQVLVDGSAVTDMEADLVVAYGTNEMDWLNLEFDGTGSWRVSLTGAELPVGIHGAVVQMTRNGVRTDIPVSVLVR
ncbi:MAG: hypothetical protein D9N11_08225 [Ketobacter sp.]|nr:MAG: hypothetical protein D9N11_08225 [Ketobacter sp.]